MSGGTDRKTTLKNGDLTGVMKSVRYRALARQWRRTRDKMQKNICALCGQKMGADVTLDHVVPLAKGGRNVFENVQAAHKDCNQVKGRSLGYKQVNKP